MLVKEIYGGFKYTSSLLAGEGINKIYDKKVLLVIYKRKRGRLEITSKERAEVLRVGMY